MRRGFYYPLSSFLQYAKFVCAILNGSCASMYPGVCVISLTFSLSTDMLLGIGIASVVKSIGRKGLQFHVCSIYMLLSKTKLTL